MLSIGSWLSLITKSEVRYIGRLIEIDFQNAALVLEKVIVCGTEDRAKNKSDVVYPHHGSTDLKVRFEGVDLKEVYLIPQPNSIPGGQKGATSISEYQQDVEDTDNNYKDELNHLGRRRHETAYIEDKKGNDDDGYFNQSQSVPQQRRRSPVHVKKPELKHAMVDRPERRMHYAFETSPEMDAAKGGYEEMLYNRDKAPQMRTNRKVEVEHDENEDNDQPQDVDAHSTTSQIIESAILRSLQQLHIGSYKNNVKKHDKFEPPAKNVHHVLPSRGYAYDERDEVRYQDNRKGPFTRTHNRETGIHQDTQLYHDEYNTRGHLRHNIKPSKPRTYEKRTNKDSKHEPDQDMDQPAKHTNKYNQRNKDFNQTASKQGLQDLLSPLDAEEIFGRTTNFATQQKDAVSAQLTPEKKTFYIKDSFFDDISCEDKDRLVAKDQDYRGKKFQENNLNIQTFGETLNSHPRHSKFSYGNNYRKNVQNTRNAGGHYEEDAGQQNGRKRDYVKNSNSFIQHHDNSRNDDDKPRRHRPEFNQTRRKQKDSSRLGQSL